MLKLFDFFKRFTTKQASPPVLANQPLPAPLGWVVTLFDLNNEHNGTLFPHLHHTLLWMFKHPEADPVFLLQPQVYKNKYSLRCFNPGDEVVPYNQDAEDLISHVSQNINFAPGFVPVIGEMTRNLRCLGWERFALEMLSGDLGFFLPEQLSNAGLPNGTKDLLKYFGQQPIKKKLKLWQHVVPTLDEYAKGIGQQTMACRHVSTTPQTTARRLLDPGEPH